MNGQRESRAGHSVWRRRVAAGISIRDLRCTFAVCAALAALAAPANAADIYWDGGDGTWNSASNWSTDPANTTPDPGSVPGNMDTAIFNRSGNNGVNEIVNLGAVQSALGLAFSNTGTTTLTGAPADHGLNLGTGGITVNSGAGEVTIGGAATPDLLGIVLIDGPTWTFSSNSSNDVTIHSVSWGGGAATLVLDGTSTANNTIAGVINSPGTLAVQKNGTGIWELANSNVIGSTTVNNGKLVLNASGGGAVSGTFVGDSAGADDSAILQYGASDQVAAGSQVTVNSDGKVDLNGMNQTFGGIASNGFVLNDATLVNSGTGTVTLGANSSITGNSGTSTVTGGTINMGGAPRVATNAGATMTVSSNLTNGGIAISGGTLNLDGNNNFSVSGVNLTGGTLNFNSNTAMTAGTLTLGAGSTAGSSSGSAISITPTNIVITGNHTWAVTNELNLGTAPVDLGPTVGGFRSITVSSGTVAIGGVISETGTLGLFKLGPGTLVLSGNNTYTGNGTNTTAIRDGTLSIPTINNASTAGPLGQVANVRLGNTGTTGTLLYTGVTASSTMPFVLTNANSSAAFNVSSPSTTLTLSGNISSGGGAQTITKLGPGTLKLTGTLSYANLTNVNEGTLLLSGTKSGTALITVGNGSGTDTLGGIGSVASSILVNSGGGVLAPGESIGTLTMTNSADITLNGKLLIEVSGTGAGSVDLLNTVDVLTITSGTVDFSVLAALDDTAYIFAKYNTLNGPTFGTVLNLPSGYQIDYNYLSGNQIALVSVPVPEPTSVALIGVAAVGLISVARRRSTCRR